MSDNSASLNIIPRDDWLAMPPEKTLQIDLRPFSGVFLMNTYTKPCIDELHCQGTLRLLQRVHMSIHKLQDIRYNFIVGGDGNIYEGRGWKCKPFLPKKFKQFTRTSLLIAVLGDYTDDTIPPLIDNAVCELIKYGVQKNFIITAYHFYDILFRKTEKTPLPAKYV